LHADHPPSFCVQRKTRSSILRPIRRPRRGRGSGQARRSPTPLIRPFGAPSPRSAGRRTCLRDPSPRLRGEGGAKRRVRGGGHSIPFVDLISFFASIRSPAFGARYSLLCETIRRSL